MASNDQLRMTCLEFKRHTGLGIDGRHPHSWGWLSEEGINFLRRLLGWCAILKKWPRQLRLIVMFLSDKLDDGPACLLLVI